MPAFEVITKTVEEAKLVLDALSDFSTFEFENRVKPDYSDAGGIVVWDAETESWEDWEEE